MEAIKTLVRGVLSMVLAMAETGLRRCFLPEENVAEEWLRIAWRL
ncbi:MAG: hypothetical protein ACLUD2_15385 [Clostridium sp.]